MAEYIFEIDDALVNEETGEAVMKPTYKGKIVRCRECKHHDGIRCFRWNSTIITGFDDFCSNGERRSEDEET